MVHTSADIPDEVQKQINRIRTRIWLVLAAIATPFAVFALVTILQAAATEEKLLVAGAFVLSFGVSLIAAKVTAHTVIDRYLMAIEDLNEAKSDFISIAAHQLKSPVSALQFTLDTFEQAIEKSEEETVQQLLTDLKTSVQRLDSLTHNLLNVTRIESDAMKSDPEEFKVVDTIDSILAELKPVADENNLIINRNFAVNNDQTVHVDPGLFYGVMENLLTNAYEHTPKDSSVSVGARREGQEVMISVKNPAAEPITESELKQMFNKFERGTDRETNTGGGGLGLYIAQLYVDHWGGSIEAHVRDDKMVEFTFSMPTEN